MSNDHANSEAVAELANEYLERHRNGERPSIEDYVREHPQLEASIREIFPVMLLMEDLAPTEGSLSGAPSGGQGLPLERLGDFRIICEIGRGGMGVVYEAVQESLGRHVALKVFPTQAALNPMYEERFRRESRSAAMLHHSNIVPVFAVGEEDGVLFYAMQFIRGAGLDHVIVELAHLRRINDGDDTHGTDNLAVTAAAKSMLTSADHTSQERASPSQTSTDSTVHLPGQTDDSTLSETGSGYWDSVARIGVQVADALAYAHGKGMLHRDIKPSNLLLDQNATVWVTDFGLAKYIEQDDLTHTGEVLGTLRYMSPEQLSGNADERSDLYSLGLTLYEMLLLRPAFGESDRRRLMRLVAESEPPRPRRVDRRIPRDLETIVLKAIEREPTRRYKSAKELSHDLSRFLRGEPIAARPVSPTERVVKWARRRPAIAGLTAALAILFIVSFGLVTWKWRDAEAAHETARIERDEARDAQDREAEERRRKEQSLKEAEQNLYYSLIAQAELEIARNQITKARTALDQAPAEWRGWEWGYLRSQLDTSHMTLAAGTTRAPWIRCLDFSSDGKLLATGGGLGEYLNVSRYYHGAVRVWNVETGKLVADLGDKVLTPSGIAISPDGKRLAVAECEIGGLHRGTLKIWDIASGAELLTMRNHLGETWLYPSVQMQFSPDGKLLAAKRMDPQRYKLSHAGLTLSQNDQLRVWDTLTGRELWQRPITNCSYEFSADSQQILARFAGTCWEEVDARSGETQREIDSPNGYRDSTGKFAVQWGKRYFRVFDIELGDLAYSIRDPEGDMGAFVIHPHGTEFATASTDNSIRIWDLTTGKALKILRGHTENLLRLQYSPDGRYLASGDWDGKVKLWDTTAIVGPLEIATGPAQTLAFSTESGHLLSMTRKTEILKEFDGETGAMIASRNLPTAIEPRIARLYLTAINHSGTRVARPARSDARQLVVWDTATGNEVDRFSDHQQPIQMVAFSTNGSRIAAASQHEVIVWNVAADGGDRIAFRHETNGFVPMSIALSPDGRQVAWSSFLDDNWNINIHSIETGTTQKMAMEGLLLVFSPDGQSIAFRALGEGVKLVDAATGNIIRSFLGPDQVEDLAFSPDGRRLAGVTRDMTVLWDPATGHEVIRLAARGKTSDPIFYPAVAFSPDGNRLAANQWNGTTLVWSSSGKTDSTSTLVEPVAHATSSESKRQTLNDFLSEIESLADQGNDNPELCIARARIHTQLGDWESSAAQYDRAVELSGGNCLLLTGHGDHLAAPHLPVDEYEAVTIEAWIKNWGSNVVYQAYGYQQWDNSESSLQFNPIGGQVQAGRGAKGNYGFTSGDTYRFRFGEVDPSEWTHLAFVYDRSLKELRTYTGGELHQRVEVPRLGPYHPKRPFWVGYHPQWHGSAGAMQSFRVSNSARYDNDFAPDEKLDGDDETVLLYDFARESGKLNGTRVTDLSGSGNHAKLVDAWWLSGESKP